MSQPHNSTDSQALVQSMLQRLRIQQERGTQSCLQTAVPITAASTGGQVGENGATNVQKISNSPVNGFGFSNGTLPKELRISAVDSNFGFKGGKIQQSAVSSEAGSSLISSPKEKCTTDGGTGYKKLFGQATQPGISPAGTGLLSPAKSLQDAGVTSMDGTTVERVSFGHTISASDKDAEQSLGQIQNQLFTPKFYAWSLKSTNEGNGIGSQEPKVLGGKNGGFGTFSQSKDPHTVQTIQSSTNSLSRRSLSGNKARRWTQKIKEKWRDRPGSFGKKAKEELKEGQPTEQATKISSQSHLLTTGTVNLTKKEESPSLPDMSDHSTSPLTQTENSTSEDFMRCSGDFDFGLGSFSLLEEIGMGQEWAKFLTPNQSASSAVQRPSEEFKIPKNPDGNPQPSLFVNRVESASNQRVFSGTEAGPVAGFSMEQGPPNDSLPVSMDVSEGKQPRVADQAGSVAHSHGATQVQFAARGKHQRPTSFAQPADVQGNSMVKGREHVNRKRQHQSTEARSEGLHTDNTQGAKNTDGEGSTSLTGSPVMEAIGEARPDGAVPLYTLNSPPLSPSSLNPFAHPRKGVLKHSISQESESSMEIMTKRRRVEENKRVHFAEEIMTIAPPDLDLDSTDSEEDSLEEDSMREQESGEERAEGVAVARRTAFPAWILALKRRNTGSKSKK